MSRIAIVALTAAALPIAERLATVLPDSTIHGLAKRVTKADVSFSQTVPHLQTLFRDGHAIVGLCASGILIRALAPVLDEKTNEPAVIAVAPDGSAVVPLLGGHHGANDLARRIGDILGIAPAVTTASDTNYGVALDMPPEGYTLANPEDHKAFAAAVLAGGTIRFNGTAPWLTDSALPFSGDGNLSISVSEHQTHGGPAHLVYYPQTLALGIGCERGCAPEEIASLVDATLSEAGLSAAAIALVASLDLKCDEPAVTALEGTLGRPIRFFDAERLEAETPRLANPSETVFRAVGCHGVAEAAALAAAGSDGDLIVEKRKSTRATCAIAKAPHAIKETSVGRGKGRLAVVGLGPGNTIWRTGEAQMLIAQASDIVGYQGYLDLIGGGTRGKTLHAYPLGEETERVDAALSLAAEGKRVALVSSGDPGIYAMAALVFERIDLAIDPEWRWVDVTVAPGISALQAAASRAGAPLGHDFCAISLSDLLTPWAVIEKRLTAAAEGDFVIALYNPASRTRRKQLDRALEILSQHRPETTPVIVARQLGRPDESVAVRDLGVFDPALVDMTTLLMIGSSETRRTAQGWVYTPRGYGDATPARKAVQGKAAKS